MDPSTITQQTQAQTNLASKDILPQQTQATTNIANKDILSQQTHAPTNLSSQATPTSTIQEIVLQQSYRASTNPFFFVSKSKLIMCKDSTNSFIYTSHRQSQVTHRVRMR